MRGLRVSVMSYCRTSPCNQQETYMNLSSSERRMSVMRAGISGNAQPSTGTAGIFTTASVAQESSGFLKKRTTSEVNAQPTKPSALEGSCKKRTSSGIAPRPKSSSWSNVRSVQSHTYNFWPYLPSATWSGSKPFTKHNGSPHSEETITLCRGWYQKSYPYVGFRVPCSQRPMISKVSGFKDTKPVPALGKPSSLGPPMNDMMISFGAQCVVWGKPTPAFSASSFASIVLWILGARGSCFTSMKYTLPEMTPGTTKWLCVTTPSFP
mmetsp:Transcript_38815/g.99160  ORF Transcript_38815/g.99160 Transcript_38815/m.99160 type:complete len:266 (+) Transcript_38815:312-1109(+)